MYNISRWKEQLQDMYEEDYYHEWINVHKVYPTFLFNLVSNPIFYLYPKERRTKAIIHMLEKNKRINKTSIIYDYVNDVVFFITIKNIIHRCDLVNQQVRIFNYNTTF
jgi:hypothetical protein